MHFQTSPSVLGKTSKWNLNCSFCNFLFPRKSIRLLMWTFFSIISQLPTSSGSPFLTEHKKKIKQLTLTLYTRNWFLLSISSFFTLRHLLGFKNCGCFRMLGHMPRSMGEGPGSSSGSVLRRFYWPIDCGYVTSVHSLPPSEVGGCLVRTRSSQLGLQHWSFR